VLYVNDVSATIDFYKRAFGLTLRFHDEALGFAELEAGGSIIAIASHSIGELLMPGVYAPPEGGRPAGVEIAFLADDVAAAFARLIAEGAAPIAAPKRMPWGLEVAYALAPDGTILGLSEPPPS
jgi:lactoylglutathione lyase